MQFELPPVDERARHLTTAARNKAPKRYWKHLGRFVISELEPGHVSRLYFGGELDRDLKQSTSAI